MTDWNVCPCGKQARYRTGKLCGTCQKRRELSGDSHRIAAMQKPWNRCASLVTPNCPNRAAYRGGTQCANCAQKKYWAKDKQKNRDRCSFYYLKNRDKERARRKAYYQANREMEILNATLRRLNKPTKKKVNNEAKSDVCGAASRIEEGAQSTGQTSGTD